MRIASLIGTVPNLNWLAYRLRIAVSAFALGLTLGAVRTRALDFNSIDGLITETVASRDRASVWSNGAIGRGEHGTAPANSFRAGNYLITPSAGTLVVFDDNVLASDADKKSDFRAETTGRLDFKSSLPRHILDFSLDGKLVSHYDNPDQDYANFRANADGALQFDSAHTLSASVLTSLEHQERSDPAYPLTARGPIEFLRSRGTAGITRDVGRLYGTISAAAENWHYGSEASAGALFPGVDGHDNNTYSAQLKTGYRISPGYEIVSKVRGYRQDNTGIPARDTDAWGFEALAGLTFEANPMLRWHILGGLGQRDYDRAGLAGFSTALLSADVEWLPTQRLSVFATVVQQILETTDNTGTGIVELGAKIRAEYKIYHNLMLTGGVEVRQDDYKGTDRSDTTYTARAGLEYYAAANWLFTFGYEHDVRDSSDDSRDMHRNRFMFGANLRF